MPSRVSAIAVWDVAARGWAAVVRSSDRVKVESLFWHMAVLMPVFVELIEVDGSDDDAVVVDRIEAVLLRLPKVSQEAVFDTYYEVIELVAADRWGPEDAGLVLN